MAPELIEKWAGIVNTVTIGVTKEDGGSCKKAIKIGGEQTLPFLFKEAKAPNKPVVAFEVWDIYPADWPPELIDVYGDALKDPLSWAKKCANEYNAQAICLRLQGAHPDFGDRTAQQEALLVKRLLDEINLPLIILGSSDDQKDNLILPACSQAAKGQRCLLGSAVQDNYKTLTAAVLADGHSIIAESPIDINIAKQLNILISDMGLPLERIVINPTIGALGYGLEYAYSIMERARLAALSGDKALANPFICFVGNEAWRAKEAKIDAQHGIAWEALTAVALLNAAAGLLVMRHPKAIEKVNRYMEKIETYIN
jgi:acetyl-CoA decarbonylase/synthase complex subunit delta